jgi:basic membrane lipoprotein Med (substrate-binding protein (PBP1-ABC) superfamily)
MRSLWFSLFLLAAAGAAAAGCQAFVTTDVGKGIGQPCAADDECQGDLCYKGLCSYACSAPADCVDPSICTPEGVCELPLEVGFIYVGVVEDEGWTLTHEEGRQYAMDNLPYLRSTFAPNKYLPNDAKDSIDGFIADGYDVIAANSFSLRGPVAEKAVQYVDKQFMTCASNTVGKNLGSYFGRMEQAFYLAGYTAGLKTSTNRLGFIGSYITPEAVRHINAFTLGAHRVDPDIVVEVRWVGFWFDTGDPVNGEYAETRLAKQLLATNCDVIAHVMDNGRSVAAVEAARAAGADVYSLGNDNQDACSKGPTSCLGTPYWNWGPLYVRLFEDIHRGTWDPNIIVNDNIGVDPAKSIANFTVNEAVAGGDVAIAVSQLLSELAKSGNEHMSFDGPYCSTGQRTPEKCVMEGETITDQELRQMCWFVEGVVEKVDPADPASIDKPGQVPQECLEQQ